MSDTSIAIVPRISSYPERKEKADEILAWLSGQGIVEKEPSDCILGPGLGYAMGSKAEQAVNDGSFLPVGLYTNGLEIVLERQVFHTGQFGLETLECPGCKENISAEDWEFLSEWASGESDNLTCPLCGVAAEIHSYKFEPTWGFSDLGFIFWNWPDFRTSFIEDFKRLLNCEIDLVVSKV